MSAWRFFARRTRPADPDEALGLLIERFEEPTAICEAHGFVRLANHAWRDLLGESHGPLRSGHGLFVTFLRARREGRASGALSLAGKDYPARVATLGPDRYVIRLQPAGAVTAPGAPMRGGAHATLAGFAHTSPFGAAQIAGSAPFNGRIVEVNDALSAVCGQPVQLGDTLGGLLTEATRAEAAASHAAGHPGPYEVSPAGAPERTAHLYLFPTGDRWLAYLLDVTDQKILQRQLDQRHKMEAIGQLAGGVAHDFNNLLTAISLRIDELLLRHPLGDPAYDNLSEIRDTVARAAHLVRQLLTFSRKATTQREIVDLSEGLLDFELMLQRLLHEDVTLLTDYGRNLPLVRVDKAQLENAIMNLVVNARDAVRAHGAGKIRLKAARVGQDEATQLGYVGPPNGDMALIEVSDDGPGIPPDVIANIFEPFFTTKPLGEGTGLGLATVYGIVKQADGWIIAQSPPGRGAIFRIFLPAYAPPLTIEPPPAATPKRHAARDLSGVGRILFVEDEDSVRGIAARLLRTRGYDVIEARDGEEALALAEQHAGELDLMISDVIMPGMDGPTLLKAARPFLGNAPVMFISGYAEAEFSDLLEGETGVSFLAKPLDIMGLAEAVKQLIHGG